VRLGRQNASTVSRALSGCCRAGWRNDLYDSQIKSPG
jgi:hypothetical protein